MSETPVTLWKFCYEYEQAIETEKVEQRGLRQATERRRAAEHALIAAMRHCKVEAVRHEGSVVKLQRSITGQGPTRIHVEPMPTSWDVNLPVNPTDDPDDTEVEAMVAGLRDELIRAVKEIGREDAIAAFEAAADEVDPDEIITAWHAFRPDADTEPVEVFHGIGSEPGDDEIGRGAEGGDEC
jgi:hypothetical protein